MDVDVEVVKDITLQGNMSYSTDPKIEINRHVSIDVVSYTSYAINELNNKHMFISKVYNRKLSETCILYCYVFGEGDLL